MKKPDIKDYTLLIRVKALENLNDNFSNNAHAIEIVEEMIKDAKCQCIRLSGKAENESNTGLVKYLESKIKTYDYIEKSLVDNLKLNT